MCIEDEKAKWAAEKGRNGERGMEVHFKATYLFRCISRQTPRDVVINRHANIYIEQSFNIGIQSKFYVQYIFWHYLN